jgi:hypothetical protein
MATNVKIDVLSLNIDASAILALLLPDSKITQGLIINLTASAEVFNRIFQFTSLSDSSSIDITTSHYKTNTDTSHNISSFSTSTSNVAGTSSYTIAGLGMLGTLGDDYLGYIAHSIFRHVSAYILFSNGPAVVTSVNENANISLNNVFVKCAGDGSLLYGISGSNGYPSPSQIIIQALYKPLTMSRFDKSFITGGSWNNNLLIPGDTICFNCTVKPDINQDSRVGTNTYIIELLLS